VYSRHDRSKRDEISSNVCLEDLALHSHSSLLHAAQRYRKYRRTGKELRLRKLPAYLSVESGALLQIGRYFNMDVGCVRREAPKSKKEKKKKLNLYIRDNP